MKLFVACFLLSISTSSFALADNSESLYHGCKTIADGNNDQSGNTSFEMGICAGIVVGVHGYLTKLHDGFYLTWFPNITYPIKDEATLARYIANNVMIGPDSCFPSGITPKILAAVVNRYGQQHPNRLTDNSFKFTVDALSKAYPCGPKQIR